jgi:hypothetical protein
MKSILNARKQVITNYGEEFGRQTIDAWRARREVGVEAMLRDPKYRQLSPDACAREWAKANPAPDLRGEARDLKSRLSAEVRADIAAAAARAKSLRRPDPIAGLLRPRDLGPDPAQRVIAQTMERVAHTLTSSAARQTYLAAGGLNERMSLFQAEAARVSEIKSELAAFYPVSPQYDASASSETKDRLFAEWRAAGVRRAALQGELDDLAVRLSIGATVIETSKPVTSGLSSEQIAVEHQRHAEVGQQIESILQPLYPERFEEAAEIEAAAAELAEAWGGGEGIVGTGMVLDIVARTGEPVSA